MKGFQHPTNCHKCILGRGKKKKDTRYLNQNSHKVTVASTNSNIARRAKKASSEWARRGIYCIENRRTGISSTNIANNTKLKDFNIERKQP